MTLTYLTARSNLLPNAFKWEFFAKLIFFKLWKPVTILACYVQSNETLAINKFQRSKLTFDLSVKVAQESHQHIKT